MDDELREITEPSAYLPHVKAGEPPAGAHAHDGAIETVREAVHRGHRIVVRTSYEIDDFDGGDGQGHGGHGGDHH